MSLPGSPSREGQCDNISERAGATAAHNPTKMVFLNTTNSPESCELVSAAAEHTRAIQQHTLIDDADVTN
jgi:hypothetical protein